jgi:glycine oxidase
MHVLVVGGGAIGCSLAYYLRRAGAEVTLLERERIGSGASSAAAGMLAPLAESHEPGPFAQLALRGLELFHSDANEIMSESGIDFEFRRDGVLRVAENDEEAERLRRILSVQPANGPPVEWLDRPALRALEPALAPSMVGALYTPREGHVNPVRLTAALAAAAARRGALILEGTPLLRLDRDDRRVTSAQTGRAAIAADHVVLAGGAWMGAMRGALGSSVPVAPVRGQMAALMLTPSPIRRVVYSHNGYLVPKADGSIFVGATEEHDAGFDTTVTARGLRSLLDVAERLVPALSGAAYLRSWAGLRPCAPDRMPIIGLLSGYDNVTVAGGHFRNGILLSLVTGRLLADFLTTGTLPAELASFSPARFTTDKR